ncbi:hypothetical protein SAMN05660657_03805 [Geodermatophilus amargosae]|uniref:GGDEF domain-containing protein n=1 Tax=Geodermatophilus amargosae TaxID=1296565 RepID=A0A1I7BU08_9ACTN|nr:hypothetical protein [Geodermatophilus amargosae]SFT90581.1 hypothetical protein SAMN05660657_03805 [Geodermatophilus amargosae]
MRRSRCGCPGFDPGELSVSLGVAVADGADATTTPTALTAGADRCLYAAKATRNAVATAAPA